MSEKGGWKKGGGTSWRFWRFWRFAVNFFLKSLGLVLIIFEITGLSVDHFGLLRRL